MSKCNESVACINTNPIDFGDEHGGYALMLSKFIGVISWPVVVHRTRFSHVAVACLPLKLQTNMT